jgi:transcriptional regulator with XRE-family HTH domain
VELNALRLAAGLTQAALADRMGTTQAAIARAESGRLSPRLDFADRWARACGLPLKLVLGDADDPFDPVKRRAMTRAMFGANNWNPFDRDLTEVERRTLSATGIHPEQFEGRSRRGR